MTPACMHACRSRDLIKPSASAHDYQMSATRSDADIKASLEASQVPQLADACLSSTFHAQHASTAFSDHRNPSVESPHNSVHGAVGGIMASYQSSFHPVFWLHHCQVDRLYEAYLALQPDSADEFEAHQATLDADGTEGFPDGACVRLAVAVGLLLPSPHQTALPPSSAGPWGVYHPFAHPVTGAPFHARDTFNAPALGFKYDALPTPMPKQQREPPWCAWRMRACHVTTRQQREPPWCARRVRRWAQRGAVLVVLLVLVTRSSLATRAGMPSSTASTSRSWSSRASATCMSRARTRRGNRPLC